jgi:hypothetical protein
MVPDGGSSDEFSKEVLRVLGECSPSQLSLEYAVPKRRLRIVSAMLFVIVVSPVVNMFDI